MRILSKAYLTAIAVAGMIVASPAAARADIILQSGNIPQTDENVLLNTGITGNPIFGTTNQTGFAVRFTGNEQITAPANGQARIEAVDGAFTYLMVDLLGASYTSLILNLDAVLGGTVDFRVTETNGQVNNFTNLAVGDAGENFFTITAINGQRIQSVEFFADVPVTFVDAAQFRIGGAQATTTVIPEPASLMLLGTGLAGLAARYRKRIA